LISLESRLHAGERNEVQRSLRGVSQQRLWIAAALVLSLIAIAGPLSADDVLSKNVSRTFVFSATTRECIIIIRRERFTSHGQMDVMRTGRGETLSSATGRGAHVNQMFPFRR